MKTTAGVEIGATVPGIRHARGANAEPTARRLVYTTVRDLDRRSARRVEPGGAAAAQSQRAP